MKRAHRSVYRDVHVDLAPVPEEHQLLPGLMHRPVGGDQQIPAEEILVQFERSLEIFGSCFFFTFQNDFHVHRQGNLFIPQSIERGEQRHYR